MNQTIEIENCPHPSCGVTPNISIDSTETYRGLYTVQCPRHGHIAMGEDKAQAIRHWNAYVQWIRKVA
jgi:hypothetical protein